MFFLQRIHITQHAGGSQILSLLEKQFIKHTQCDREMEDSQEFDLTWCSVLLLHGLLPCSEVLCFVFASGLERQSVSVLLQSHTASV